MTKLKPCPFCGEKVTTDKGFGGITFFYCEKCSAIVSFRDITTTKNSIAVWNSRVEKEEV